MTSAGVAILGWDGVATVRELSDVPRSLPLPVAPMLRLVPSLVIPAVSLAFVGLVQERLFRPTFLTLTAATQTRPVTSSDRARPT